MQTFRRFQSIAVVRYVVVLLGLASVQASAQNLFFARAYTTPGSPADIDLGLEDATAVAFLPFELQDCSSFGKTCTADASAGAYATRGTVRMGADVDILNMGASVGALSAFARASFAGEDVIFGAPDAMISTSMTPILNGYLKATWEGSETPPVASQNQAVASVRIDLTIFDGGNPIVDKFRTLEVRWNPVNTGYTLGGPGSPLFLPLIDVSSPRRCDGLHPCHLTVNFVNVPVEFSGLSLPTGRPLTLILALTAIARNQISIHPAVSHLTVEANFPNSLELPTDRPVFDLPAGATVNSAHLGIVDNHYVGPESSDTDGDGVPDEADSCPGSDDTVDADLDGLPDGCDVCPLDAANDADADDLCADADNCPLTANADQADFDQDGAGDACDADADGDHVSDTGDRCLFTPVGAVTNANGCALEQVCLCEGPWKNHGAYVRCVAHTAKDFAAEGVLSKAAHGATVAAAAKSPCGHRP
jgi:hypothetical protein